VENKTADKDLVIRCLQGAEQDFEELIKRYSKKLYLFIFSRTGSPEDTEDILQETFMKAFANLSSYNPKWEFSTWIYTIASRTTLSYFRYTRVRQQEPEIPLNPSPTPEEEIMKDDIRNIWETADRLGELKNEILRLRYSDGFSIREISKITGRSAVNIRVLLYRAKNELIRLLHNSENMDSLLNKGPEKRLT